MTERGEVPGRTDLGGWAEADEMIYMNERASSIARSARIPETREGALFGEGGAAQGIAGRVRHRERKDGFSLLFWRAT
jgi:hypothetical protein